MFLRCCRSENQSYKILVIKFCERGIQSCQWEEWHLVFANKGDEVMGGFVAALHDQPSALQGMAIEDIQEKLELLIHRGPEDCGFYFDTFIQMGYRKLQVQDDKTSSQPINVISGRYWIVFSGKIYNYKELRIELAEEENIFRMESETEVLVALFDKMKERMLQKIRGMYAFLIWDRKEQTLFGARDPFGMKPLYYLAENEIVYFSSEPKGILGLVGK